MSDLRTEIIRTAIVGGNPVLIASDKYSSKEYCFDSRTGQRLPIPVPSNGKKSALAEILCFSEEKSRIEDRIRSTEDQIIKLCSEATKLINDIVTIHPDSAWNGEISELSVRTQIANLRQPSLPEKGKSSYVSMFDFAFHEKRTARVLCENNIKRKKQVDKLIGILLNMKEEALFCVGLESTESDDPTDEEQSEDDETDEEQSEDDETDADIDLVEADSQTEEAIEDFEESTKGDEEDEEEEEQQPTDDDDDDDELFDDDEIAEEDALVQFLITPTPPPDFSDLDY